MTDKNILAIFGLNKVSLSKFDLSIMERRGAAHLIGVDEAGRGPLAGPVTAAAAYIPVEAFPFLGEVNDSKKLNETKRVLLLAHMRSRGVKFGFGFSGVEDIGRFNILGASLRAMAQAVARLAAGIGAKPRTALVLVDGPHKIKGLPFKQETVVRGDERSISIAAASIFAKVARDKWMALLDMRHPGYGLAVHKGYGTRIHLAALKALGPSPVHRMSFAPVKSSFARLRKDRAAGGVKA